MVYLFLLMKPQRKAVVRYSSFVVRSWHRAVAALLVLTFTATSIPCFEDRDSPKQHERDALGQSLKLAPQSRFVKPVSKTSPFRFPDHIWKKFQARLKRFGDNVLYSLVKNYGLAWTDSNGKIHWIDEILTEPEAKKVWNAARKAINRTQRNPFKWIRKIAEVKEVVAFHESVHVLFRDANYKGLIAEFREKLESQIGPLTTDHPFIVAFRKAYGEPHLSEIASSRHGGTRNDVDWYLEEFLTLSVQEAVLFDNEYAVLNRMAKLGEVPKLDELKQCAHEYIEKIAWFEKGIRSQETRQVALERFSSEIQRNPYLATPARISQLLELLYAFPIRYSGFKMENEEEYKQIEKAFEAACRANSGAITEEIVEKITQKFKSVVTEVSGGQDYDIKPLWSYQIISEALKGSEKAKNLIKETHLFPLIGFMVFNRMGTVNGSREAFKAAIMANPNAVTKKVMKKIMNGVPVIDIGADSWTSRSAMKILEDIAIATKGTKVAEERLTEEVLISLIRIPYRSGDKFFEEVQKTFKAVCSADPSAITPRVELEFDKNFPSKRKLFIEGLFDRLRQTLISFIVIEAIGTAGFAAVGLLIGLLKEWLSLAFLGKAVVVSSMISFPVAVIASLLVLIAGGGELFRPNNAWERLEENSHIDIEIRLNSYALLGILAEFKPHLVSEKSVGRIIADLKHNDFDVRRAAASVIVILAKHDKGILTSEVINALILTHQIDLLRELHKQYPELFDIDGSPLEAVKELCIALDDELDTYPESKEKRYLERETISAINKYTMMCGSRNDLSWMIEKYKEAAYLISIVHADLAWLLNNLRDEKLSFSDFKKFLEGDMRKYPGGHKEPSKGFFNTINIFIKIKSPLIKESLLHRLIDNLSDMPTQGFQGNFTETLKLIAEHRSDLLTDDVLKRLVRGANFGYVYLLMKNRPDLFEGIGDWTAPVRNLCVKITEETQTQPEELREAILRNYTNDISVYAWAVVAKDDLAGYLEEYRQIIATMDIVHSNISLVLRSLTEVKISLKEFKDLRKAIPFNNPLTRILRMLGERKETIGGYRDVTQKVKNAGGLGFLRDLILKIARKKGRSAPQEIAGVLEIVREYPQGEINKWGEKAWRSFDEDIEAYYAAGFKVISYKLFDYFRVHRNDPIQIKTFKDDIEKELGSIAWGNFQGLSEEFKAKYGLTAVDELSLLSNYIPIANLSGRDYEDMYGKIQAALKARPDNEVPEEARQLFTFEGTKSAIVYQAPAEERAAEKRDALHKNLVSYAEIPEKDLEGFIADHLHHPEQRDDAKLKRAIMVFLAQEGGIDVARLKAIPTNDEDAYAWLGGWSTILRDTWKEDIGPKVRTMLRNKVAALSKGELAALREKYNVPEVLGSKRKKKDEETSGDKDNSIDDKQRRLIVLADKIYGKLVVIFSDDIEALTKELDCYKRVEQAGSEAYYAGYFDDLLHLMSFMMTGVCTWVERARQVADKRYHFGKIAVKNAQGRILAVSQVQLVRSAIVGLSEKASPQGWRVLALPGVNPYEGEIGISKEKAVLAMLQLAQRLAKDSGMQGAVIPAEVAIYAQRPFERKIIVDLFKKGWLKKATLSESITLSNGGMGAQNYTYKDVYLVQIPESEFFITSTETGKRVEEEDIQAARLAAEESIPFGEGFGEIVFPRQSNGMVQVLKDASERALASMPKDLAEQLRLENSFNDIRVSVKLSPETEHSIVNKTEDGKEVTLVVGKDLAYAPSKLDATTFNDLFSEVIAALILKDYQALKERSATNENAYLKLAVVKALINYRNYLRSYHKVLHRYNWSPEQMLDDKAPEEQAAVLERYRASLDQYTRGLKGISQWNIFLNVMDDVDPDFLITNYIHLLLSVKALTDDDFSRLAKDASQVEVLDKPSIASIRNAVKDILCSGKAILKIADDIQEKERFGNFDQTDAVQANYDTLAATEDVQSYYRAWRNLLSQFLPLTEKELNEEVSQLVNQDIFHAKDRQSAIHGKLQEVLRRRIGGGALASFIEHLRGQRGIKNIPYINLSSVKLNEGEDADAYEFLRYLQQEDDGYRLVSEKGGIKQEAPKDRDWVRQLFNMGPDDPDEGDGGGDMQFPSDDGHPSPSESSPDEGREGDGGGNRQIDSPDFGKDSPEQPFSKSLRTSL